MSMALAIEHTVLWMREKQGYSNTQCGAQYDAMPPVDCAGPFYIAVDDAGVETGQEETDSLLEILTLTIGIWRRPEHLTSSQRGILKLPHDKYLVGSWTLHDMERKLLLPRLQGLHKNYEYLTGLNTRYNLPHTDYGSKFTTPLVYRGRGRMESIGLAIGEGSVNSWYGYRLRFRGLRREQKLRSTTDAQG